MRQETSRSSTDILLILIAFALLLFFSDIARAELPANASAPTGTQSVEIVEDQEDRAFRFMIDGQEVAVLDAEGFHVNGSIDYSGMLTDGNQYSRTSAEAAEEK